LAGRDESLNAGQMRLSKGILIAFEGIDGSGKSTHAKILYDDLIARGFDAVFLKEPTNGMWGDKIRKIAKFGREGISPKEELDYFINDRIEDVQNNIGPSLRAKRIVIMDRYYISTMAYQGAILGNPEEIRQLNEKFAPLPDAVFLLDLEPDIAISRIIKGRDIVSPGFEQEDYLRKVRAIFNDLNFPGLRRIDAMLDVRQIKDEIYGDVDALLRKYIEK
jgi:dTMP kinase